MVTISVFCNLKEPLLVRFIIIARTVINHSKSENISLYNFNINHFAHFVPTDNP